MELRVLRDACRGELGSAGERWGPPRRPHTARADGCRRLPTAAPVVTARATKLGIGCIQAVEDKALAIASACADFGVELAETMFVGNDINDIPAFKLVGYPVCVADAYPEVLPYTLFQTQRSGGLGAVREVCDMIFAVKSAALAGETVHVG